MAKVEVIITTKGQSPHIFEVERGVRDSRPAVINAPIRQFGVIIDHKDNGEVNVDVNESCGKGSSKTLKPDQQEMTVFSQPDTGLVQVIIRRIRN